MSKNFNALCYIRIFSDKAKQGLDEKLWKSVKIRNDAGFNHVSRSLFFNIVDLNGALSRLYSDYISTYKNIRGPDDVGEIYIWLDNKADISEFNTAEMGRDLLIMLTQFDCDVLFSVEELFPGYENAEFKYGCDCGDAYNNT